VTIMTAALGLVAGPGDALPGPAAAGPGPSAGPGHGAGALPAGAQAAPPPRDPALHLVVA
jgi:hypothetical protein